MRSADDKCRLEETFALQRTAFAGERYPSLEVRQSRIDRLIELILTCGDELAEAIALDFRHRSAHLTALVDGAGLVPSMKFTRSHLKAWMRPETKSSGMFSVLGARARIEWQPLGVVGVMASWNFPVNLALLPACQALAAGNRVMLRLSEHTPRTSQLLQRAIAERFDPAELVAVTGGVEVGVAFSQLPFQHLLFTGAASVGKEILRHAAPNLTPVTLELGGKCPLVLAPDGDLAQAARGAALGKVVNAGQICLAPDYALVPHANVHAFVNEVRGALGKMLPTLRDNPDFTAIISERHEARLRAYLDDARGHGAEIIELNPAQESLAGTGKVAPTLVVGATAEMKVMQEEIFGPILPIVAYHGLDDAIERINSMPHPLGIYYFGRDQARTHRFLQETHSGGVTINDIFHHAGNDELPFGGVGGSGMGSYHGVHGFRTFSHARSVQVGSRLSINFALVPPYGERVRWMIRSMRERELADIRKRLSLPK